MMSPMTLLQLHKQRHYLMLFIVFFAFLKANGQESIAPVRYNPVVKNASATNSRAKFYRTTALALPFFEDFTNPGPYPDSNKWMDNEVYVNNTMCIQPIARGVATFDLLNNIGLPYDTLNNFTSISADSLTSKPIDLSAHVGSDSIYLSFFYQPGGYGFYPDSTDSLSLYLHTSNNDWIKVWSVNGTKVQAFRQVMIAINDTGYLNANFQFRFINIGANRFSGSTWNVDYIRLAANRNRNDTAVNDIAYTTDPSYMLNDYTSMPYRQYLANPAKERAANMTDTIRNNYATSQAVPYSYTAREVISNTLLSSGGASTLTIPAYTQQQITFPTYTNAVPIAAINDKVVFENKFYLQSPPSEPKANDTIIRDQIFDNYLAYDDGTAEQAYYLNLFPSAPGMLAIEYHLNQPDTLRGLAIYFNRQVPVATYKTINLFAFNKLQGINGAFNNDTAYFDRYYVNAGYADTINHFYNYRFSKPVPLPAGTFYVGAFLPAFSGSDSLYFGLDRNRIGGNHAYFNVLGSWGPSVINGAIMIRPLLGQYFTGTGVHTVQRVSKWSVSPNPASNVLYVDIKANENISYLISDIQGRILLTGSLNTEHHVDISSLHTGMYFLQITDNGAGQAVQKFIKE
ncbi:MAG: T9SS type A sorting domain-containing protein [Taibaiella sp.]|nr:T9SS type A sorting domain-containing protein [Taibaiella sp.]